MALKSKGLDHLNLYVRNLRESTGFYSNLFGFKILKDQRPEYESYIIGDDSMKIAMYEKPDLVVDEESGFNHMGICVENFNEVLDTCRKLGVKITYENVNWGKSQSVYIEDPNGYEIEISSAWGGGL